MDDYLTKIEHEGFVIVESEEEAGRIAELVRYDANIRVEKRGRKYIFYKKEKEAEISTKLLDSLIPDGVRFFLDHFAECYAEIEINGHKEILPIRSDGYKRYVTIWLTNNEKLPSREKISQLVAISEAKAITSGLRFTLHNRSARLDNSIYIDLTREDYKVMQIKQGECILTDTQVPTFRRYAHMKEIKVDTTGTHEDYEKFLDLLNLNQKQRLLYSIYVPTNFIPDMPHPVLIVTGSQGSAKTTLFDATRRIIDNSEVRILSLTNNQNDFIQQLQHNYAPFYDNIRELYDWQADMLSRASTGEGVMKRALYTNDDAVFYKYKRCIGINGINLPTIQSDLLDRAIVFNLERISKEKRLTSEEVQVKIEELMPKVLGFLFTSLAKALQEVDNVKAELNGKLPRMADFTVYGEAIARSMGCKPYDFYNAYMENILESNKIAVIENPIGNLVIEFLQDKPDTYEIGATEFYSSLELFGKAKGIDLKANRCGAPHILTRRLNLLKANLMELGIDFTTNRDSKARLYTFKRSVISVNAASGVIKAYEHNDDNDPNDAVLQKDLAGFAEDPAFA